MAVQDAVAVAVAEKLPAEELEAPVAVRRHARREIVAAQAGDGVHEGHVVPEIGIRERGAHARRLGRRRHRIRLEGTPGLDEGGDPVAEHLDARETRRRLLVFRPKGRLPIGVARTAAAALAGIAAEETAAGLGVDV